MPLGPGKPNGALRDRLAALDVDAAFAGHVVADRVMADAAISGVWLLHNFLDESHTISQDIHTPTGSYWHGIMHRREPDYSNAGYWFHKVGQHPVFGQLGVQTADLTGRAKWEPFRFIDECEQAARAGGVSAQRCIDAQMIEWWVLFDYCYRKAIGA
ncbi:MAG: hypothetical protein GC159_20195 [Phycisphaera sp.]|nr:hypothetical protein [Phycisphaera sp.]